MEGHFHTIFHVFHSKTRFLFSAVFVFWPSWPYTLTQQLQTLTQPQHRRAWQLILAIILDWSPFERLLLSFSWEKYLRGNNFGSFLVLLVTNHVPMVSYLNPRSNLTCLTTFISDFLTWDAIIWVFSWKIGQKTLSHDGIGPLWQALDTTIFIWAPWNFRFKLSTY